MGRQSCGQGESRPGLRDLPPNRLTPVEEGQRPQFFPFSAMATGLSVDRMYKTKAVWSHHLISKVIGHHFCPCL